MCVEQDASRIRRELTADFHRLNVLLIHIEAKSMSPVARKVAMASLSEAKIQANFGIRYCSVDIQEDNVIVLFYWTEVMFIVLVKL